MQLSPYVSFNGQCEEAFKFYEQHLGGKIESMFTYGGSPMEKQAPPEWSKKIMHARMTIGAQALMGSDPPPGRYQEPKGFSLSLDLKDSAEAERLFQKLAEKGQVEMPMQKTFWAERFGMLVDRFGISWLINCGQAAAATP
jgi:PhnB protein